MTRWLVLAALALALAAPQAASAEKFIAIGVGHTVCEFTAVKDPHFPLLHAVYDYYGETECDRPVEQTGHAFIPNSPLVGEVCSGFRTHCYSGDVWVTTGGVRYSDPLEYHVTVRAPEGQGWIGAPTECSGVGTDNLKCVFKSDLLGPYVK